MSFDKDLSELKDFFLELQEHNDICDVARDRFKFFVWELKFLDNFLALQDFTFAGECGMLDVTQKMQQIWKTVYAVVDEAQAEVDSDEDAEADSDEDVDAEANSDEDVDADCDVEEYSDSDAYADAKAYSDSDSDSDSDAYADAEADPDSDSDAYADAEGESDANAFVRSLFTGRRDEFIESNTNPFDFHVPTEIWKIKLEFRAKYSSPEISIPLPAYRDDVYNPKFVMEFINVVAENLNVLVQNDDPCSLLFVPGPKKQIEDVLKELKLLRLFVCVVSDLYIEPQNLHTFLTYVLVEAGHAAMIVWLYLPIHGNGNQDLVPSEMNVMLSDLLQMKAKPVQLGINKFCIDVLQALKSIIQSDWHLHVQNEHAAESGSVETPAHILVELPTISNPSWIVSLNDQMTILQEHENMTLEDVNRALGLGLPGNIQPIKAMTYLIIRKGLRFNFPRIHELGYVDFLLRNLKEFQGRYSGSLAPIKNQLHILEKELNILQPFLKDVAEEKYNKLKTLQDYATQLIGRAYEVEYIVDACICKEVPDWCVVSWFSDIIQEITVIRAEVAEISKKQVVAADLVLHGTVDAATVHTSSQLVRTRSMTEEIVGFEDVIEELRKRLISERKELDVISIAGMPGLGKTTLAYKLYYDKSVVPHFDIRAQCCVSQVYKRSDLLKAIIHDAIGASPDDFPTEADAAEKLRKTLLTKRYLILVDDVWEANAWDDLRPCFYDAKNGSRIILTTRHLEVANYATSISKPISLRMFNDEESWKLLQHKVFGKESCSSALEKVGQQIGKRCGGLPLSIVLVAGILQKMEKEEKSWKQVAWTLGSDIHSDSKAIIEQSYQNLPYHLKSCFLYFGAFAEDIEIDVSSLTRLWIAEAFIKSCGDKSLEDIAEGYLENLIERNLVMAARRDDLDGKVEACCIHDLLLEFCKERATEENLLRWIEWDQNANPSSCIYPHKHPQCRLAFSGMRENLEELSSSCSLVSSVLFAGKDSFYSRISKVYISLDFNNFKFLKVLNLENALPILYFPTDLVYLMYFAARIKQESIPSSIANLRNLETLIVRGAYYSLPITVWKMATLRHLHITGCFWPLESVEELFEDSSKLYDMKTVSTPLVGSIEELELVLTKAPNIRELRCGLSAFSRDPLPLLDFPTQLQTLDIFGPTFDEVLRDFPICISVSNLKKMTVSTFRLGLQHLSNFARLQTLQALELSSVDFVDEEWEVSNDEFPQLKILKLKACRGFKEWTVDEDAFSNLERLVLHECEYLKEIPSCFCDIPSLKYIEVEKCNESIVESARVIRETQVEDYQNSDFKLFIRES
ncbi:hypothetical protein HAX54_011463 [Datura stramonium]|uniref:Uncharacterized protein n=1 Tax=Datura stramonium TaxID=4076 RepID=A0ABS8TJY9_DATST|nr:hypothetical protein [Datura stramonium]